MTTRILCVAGARPNFVKIAPLLRALGACPGFEPRLVHTGQHYAPSLSRVFFEDLALPPPDLELAVGSGSHAEQTAEVMVRFERLLESEQPKAVLVVGDVNSTLACALTAARFRLAAPFRTNREARRRPVVIHVEAGLRSFDPDMPEEVNRRLTDAVSDLLYVSEPAALENLRREGIASDRCELVGNVLIDSLVASRTLAAASPIRDTLGLGSRPYGVVTLHRPGNVDDLRELGGLLGSLDSVARELPLVFPVHPRTQERIATGGILLESPRWTLTEPLGYLDFLQLLAGAKVVLTDSGGLQEETTVLGVPCLTLRENTERPCTLELGTNRLVGRSPERLRAAWDELRAEGVTGRIPPLWDGRAAERVAASLSSYFAED